MSNKLLKNRPKTQPVSKTEVNDDDPKIIKLLKNRLKAKAEKNKLKDQFTSSIIYLVIEFCLFCFYYVTFKDVKLEQEWLYPALICSNIIISVYNIIVSIYQIYKKKFRKIGNIVLIVLHSLFILLSIYALF